MQLAIEIVITLAALIGLITAYINYKKEKVKKPVEDNGLKTEQIRITGFPNHRYLQMMKYE